MGRAGARRNSQGAEEVMSDIRYYRGILEMEIIAIKGRKALVEYLEEGWVGPEGIRKQVFPGDEDVILTRHCWRNKK